VSTPFKRKWADARSAPQTPPHARSTEGDAAAALAARRRPLLPFVLLLFALSVPFWLVGARAGLELLPGLPVGALMALSPVVAASIVVYRADGGAGVAALLRRAFDFRRVRARVWYLPVLLLMPALMALAYAVMRVLGMPLPTPEFPLAAVPGMFVAFLAFGLCEELGWSGYATDPAQARWDALGAGVLLGLVWAGWHVVVLVQAHRSPVWIAFWALGTVALRVLTVWLYNNAGKSVFAASLFHAMQNLTWQLFPNQGSHYDPRVTGPVLACAAAVVAAVWGPRTLTRSPAARGAGRLS
jgi:hypothetical protein